MYESKNLKFESIEEEALFYRELYERQKSKIESLENKLKSKDKILQKYINSSDKNKSDVNRLKEQVKEKDAHLRWHEQFYTGLIELLKQAVANKMVADEALLKTYLTNFDGAADDSLKIVEDYFIGVNNLVAQLLKSQDMNFGQGNEKVKVEPDQMNKQFTDLINALNDCRGSKFESGKGLTKIYKALKACENQIPEEEREKYSEFLSIIESCQAAEKKQEQAEPTKRGRVNNKFELPVKPSRESATQAAKAEEPKGCPDCKAQELVEIGERQEFLKSCTSGFQGALGAYIEEHLIKLFRCPVCGHFVAAYCDGEDHPLLPSRDISTNSIIRIADYMQRGLPLDRIAKNFEKSGKLGSNTVSYSLHEFAGIYLTPLYNAIYSALSEEKVIFVDETTWDCLQDQGRGKQAANAQPSEPRSKNFILAVGNVPSSEIKLRYYHYMKSRATADIEKIVSPDFKFDVMVTDAYSAYNNVMESHPQAAHQLCLVHFRRTLLDAIKAGELIKDAEDLSQEQLDKLVAERLLGGNGATEIAAASYCISALFRWERLKNSSKVGSPEYQEAHRQQVLCFKQTCRLMEKISQELVELKGGRWTGKNKSYLTKACVYFKNNREALSTFMADPAVPIDTNSVERLIRPIACYRKSVLFKHNPEYVQSMCMIFTVFATLQANGIEDPESWLRSYSTALYIHMLEKLLYITEKSGSCVSYDQLLKKRIRISTEANAETSVGNLIKGFDFRSWTDKFLRAA